ncbi:MAG TPA: P-type conjugative transfer protein VirB9 [Thiomonas arsenitoxydans]|jgi:type IV secretion system protein VirB9|uniref:P-type conjugative transfer protein VirB9 n=1 Tax=Thiomonas arsenitoxydans (strain DSM 22701 / CIP 110005 / 3As) TaxID=426114 RepID=UPI000BD3213B|nr:P-type conjugative transfer protein VirB9 [Thiomonas arsenitoxydans]OZB55751.1 MAG: P-type conjugative transfer protein VirB9 [Thiomonas sp. 15-63-373]HML83101.1 P-type conjugative transfer protein VirB9 [Thiomonas arsenitoxydans]
MKNLRSLMTGLSLIALGISAAHAAITPPLGNEDPRVRVVPYQKMNVTELHTFFGVSTHIALDKGEQVQDIACGDSAAWDIVARGNNLFLKPRAQHADTNLTIITNRRTYNFELIVLPFPANSTSAWRDKHLIYSLSFLYPNDTVREQNALLAAQAQAAAREQAEKEQRAHAQKIKDELKSVKTGVVNTDYWAAGNASITPIRAYDNGQFTYLTFGPHSPMPSVYALSRDDRESLLNTNVEGNTIVVQRLAHRLVLRFGKRVVCIENRGYSTAGAVPQTGTISPAVQRVIVKGNNDE